jgi:hypothetical protein
MIPANNPFLHATAIVNFADIAVAEIEKCQPMYYPGFDHKWYEKVMRFGMENILGQPKLDRKKEIQAVLDKLEPLTINWDTSTVGGSNGQILLKPGYRYILTASVGIYPIYRQTQYFGYTYIDGYGTALEGVGISTEKLGYLEKTDAKVIFQISILDNLSQMFIKHNSSVDLLSAQFGAAVAYMGLGLLLLSYWQQLFCRVKKYSAWAHMKAAELKENDNAANTPAVITEPPMNPKQIRPGSQRKEARRPPTNV